MRIPTVSKFLCCIPLPTGNKIVAWFYLILYLIVAGFVLFAFIFGVDFIEFVSIDEKNVDKNETYIYGVTEVGTSRIEFLDAAGTIVICVILAFVAFHFIDGINSHDPSKMLPFMIQTFIFGVLFLGASMFFLTVYFLIKAFIMFYIFICAFSLHQVFTFENLEREENEAEMRKYTENVYENQEGRDYAVNYEESNDYQGP